MSSTDDFIQASDVFIRVVGQIAPEQWSVNGLGSWDVRSLVGHTARAILTVENYLDADEPGQVSIETAEAYYAQIYADYTDPTAVAARGVEAGVWLGDDPVTTIVDARGRARNAIGSAHSGRLVSLGGLGIPLDEYLRTRVFELVVHTFDIGRATDIDVGMPLAPLTQAVLLGAAIALGDGRGPDLLLALAGRQALPEGFSVV